MKPGDTVPSANEPAELENQAVEPENATAEAENQPLNRRILSLAVPSLGSLLAEPLMVMADSAMIGHVGTTELAGLTLGSSVNVFLVGICIFLVYTTTAVASRQLGA
ncbi:MATE family efflux transporter, partial [Mobiluncus curtisii]